MEICLSEKAKKEAATMIHDWAEYWLTDVHLGESDPHLDDDPDGLKLVVRLAEHFSVPENKTTQEH